MEDATISVPKRPSVGAPIKQHFADGKWHRIETIARKIGAEPDHVRATLKTMAWQKTFGCNAERKPSATHEEWRIFKVEKKVSTMELTEKLTPLIEGLKAEGKKHMASISPDNVADLARKLEVLLAEWTE